VFPDLDYARLEKSFEYFVEHYASAELITPRSHPVKLWECDERSRMSRARRALAVAIADFVDCTQDFCRERVSEIDRDLQKRDAYTLSFLREHFTRRRNKPGCRGDREPPFYQLSISSTPSIRSDVRPRSG
jgi:hypothetical protein